MGVEQRKFPRFEVKLDVRFAHAAHSAVFVSENLSIGGVFLVTDADPANVGDQVSLAVSVPGSEGVDEETALLGTVVHSVPPLGLGVKFDWTRSSDEARQRLEGFLAECSLLDASAIKRPPQFYD